MWPLLPYRRCRPARIFFDAEPTGAAAAYQPRYNAAPTTTQLVIREAREGGREIVPMRWGLVGHRSGGPDSKLATFNARAENLETSSLWRVPFHRRRCIVPVDGYF